MDLAHFPEAFSIAMKLLTIEALPNIEVLNLVDKWWNDGTDYTQLPNILSKKCPHLRELSLDFDYQTEGDNDTVVLWPATDCLTSLDLLVTLSIHRDLLFACGRNPDRFRELGSLLPPNLETLQVTGFQPHDIDDKDGYFDHPQALARRAMTDVTPLRPLALPEAHTRAEGLESPSHLNLRTSRRVRQPEITPAVPLTLGGGTTSTLLSTTTQRIQAIEQLTTTRYRITQAVAAAIDQTIQQFTAAHEIPIAKDLQRRLAAALEVSLQGFATATPPTSQESVDGCSAQTWAGTAQTPKPPTEKSAPAAPQKGPKPVPTRSQSSTPDHRILITMPTSERLRPASPYAIRQAVCNAVKIPLGDIPKATTTKTGWALTPANPAVRNKLLEQENKELMLRSIGGDAASIPQTWINYAVQGVASSYRSITGAQRWTLAPITKPRSQ
ncbi:hypothetical protein EJ07DRAFT_184892 [Lizonia empirigonia]|nr:hypothetical protein EJ07DRAFT_184892 [Lizonia empirigonia]